MINNTQEQVEAVKHVKPIKRLLLFDATGNLIDIPKCKGSYGDKRILSFFMMMKG